MEKIKLLDLKYEVTPCYDEDNNPLPIIKDYFWKEPIEFYDKNGLVQKRWASINEYYNRSLTAVGGYEYRFDNCLPIGDTYSFEDAVRKLEDYINSKRDENYRKERLAKMIELKRKELENYEKTLNSLA